MRNNYLMKYLENESYIQNLKSKQNLIDKILRNNVQNLIFEKKYNFFSYIKLTKTRNLILNSGFFLAIRSDEKKISEDEIDETLKKIFSLVKNFANKNNTELYVVYLPYSFRYGTHDEYKNNDNLPKYFNDIKYLNNTKSKLIKITNELKINFIDLNDYLVQENINLFYTFKLTNYFNEYGYKSITNYIFNKIENQNSK